MADIIDVVTESGRRYRIDLEGRFWVRIARNGYWEPDERIWSLKVGTELAWPWHAPDAWEDADQPEVGKHLFLSGKDVWYVSTPVSRIVPVDSWNAPVTELNNDEGL
jgi:hypothetical protein